MQIKTTEGDKSVASKALGATALGLAIPGTLAFLNQMGGLGCGNFGWNNFGWGNCGGFFGGCNNANGYLAAGAVAEGDTRYIGRLESHISKLESERYTDSVGIDLYREIIATSKADDEKINANYRELAKFIAALDKQIAVDKQQTVDNFAFLNNKIDDVRCDLNQKIRSTRDEILCYCNATFVPGKLVMPLSSVCPEPMQRYNSWTAPTTTPTTAEA